jgi:adenylate kinase
MRKVVIVTGTPGTGKTYVAKTFAKAFSLKYIDVKRIILKDKLSEGYDKKRKTKIIDTNKLSKALVSIINNPDKGIVIDSHMSHFIPSNYVDLCIVTKCDLKKLNKRLKKRGYHKSKIRENLDSEIFDICYNEAKERGHKILVVDTTKKMNIKDIKKLVVL